MPYINDIKSVIQNSYCHLYADDTIILKSASDLRQFNFKSGEGAS